MADTHQLVLPDDYRERLPRSWWRWVDQLPELVESYLERWELRIAGSLPLSYCLVVPVERGDGRKLVLKLQPVGLPGVIGAERELLGLRLAGPVAAVVVAEDAANGALLLERALPGTTLEGLAERDDDAATETMATVIRDYGRPLGATPPSGLGSFGELAEAFEDFDRGPHGRTARAKAAAAAETRMTVALGLDERGTAVPELRSARATAERVLAELATGTSEPYLLHGDLHHGNVLADEMRGLVVIDPWGLRGDRLADVAPALHNPNPLVAAADDVDSLVRRRLAIYAEVLEADREQLAAWCYVYDTIRALWSLADAGRAAAVLPADDPVVRTVAALRRLI